jgi:urea carboxylase
MFGVAAAPIYDPTQKLSDFSDFMVFFNPGDIVKFKSVSEDEYRSIQAEVDAGTFAYKQVPFQFDLGAALADPESYNKKIMEALDGV